MRGLLCLRVMLEPISSSDEVNELWNSREFAVQTTDALGNTSHPPLLVRYIDEGSIVVPGMSGMSISYLK